MHVSSPPLLQNERENDTLPLPIPKNDNNAIAHPKKKVPPPPPFLHPLLRIKREVDEIVLLRDCTINRDVLTTTLFPYPHPIVRCKRGVDNGDSANPKTDTRSGNSMVEQQEEHDKGKCYFHKERKTSHETEERPVFSQVKGCGGELRRLVHIST